MDDLITGEPEKSNQERVGLYFAASDTNGILVLPLISAALFGLVHCIAWNFKFSSLIERTIWRISAVGLSVLLSFFGVFGIFLVYIDSGVLVLLTGSIVFLAYIFSRYFLLIEGLISLRDLPPSALLTIKWSNFFPHI
ncbi:hypothetical protein BDQ17DRAFT_184622 [Cyathus striatus]|nr:hypothetical protein BDQ17DRAFT_184622 [Cyathus striatus]